MRHIVVALVALWATSAHALEWAGEWTVDGSAEKRRVSTSPDGKVYVDAKVARERTVRFEGMPGPSSLALEGGLGTTGLVGVLELDPKKRVTATLFAQGEQKGKELFATVRIAVQGKELRRESWRRAVPDLEIVSIEADGQVIAGEFDAKRSKTGVVVRYRVRGSLFVQARVEVASDHASPSFYKSPRIFSKDEGMREPGEYRLVWNGRDDTSAKRIALGGPYRIILEGGSGTAPIGEGLDFGASSKKPVVAERRVEIAKPRFEFIGSHFKENPAKKLKEWDPTNLLRSFGERFRSIGYGFEGPTLLTRASDAHGHLREAASACVDSHGTPGYFCADDGNKIMSFYEPENLPPNEYKDLHFVILSTCGSGSPLGAPSSKTSLADTLARWGADIVLGFRGTVAFPDSAIFEDSFLGMLARGETIEKSSRDSARVAFVGWWLTDPKAADERKRLFGNNVPRTDAEIDETIARERARTQTGPVPVGHEGDNAVPIAYSWYETGRGAGVREDETLFPPRYGNSTN